MTIIERIIQLADDRGIRKAELYKTCGIPQSTFSTWTVANANSIPSEYVPKIAEFLHISCDELLTGERNMIDLPENQSRLLTEFEKLDWEGQQVVLGALIAEKRRMEQSEG